MSLKWWFKIDDTYPKRLSKNFTIQNVCLKKKLYFSAEEEDERLKWMQGYLDTRNKFSPSISSFNSLVKPGCFLTPNSQFDILILWEKPGNWYHAFHKLKVSLTLLKNISINDECLLTSHRFFEGNTQQMMKLQSLPRPWKTPKE